METTLQTQHSSNRQPSADVDSSVSVFRYDSNNVAAIQNDRLQRKRAEEAARRHAEEMEAAARNLASEIGSKEQAVKELIALRSEYDALQSKYSSVNSSVKGLETSLKARNDELAGVRKEIEIAKKEVIDIRSDCETLRTSQSSLNNTLLITNNEKMRLMTQIKDLTSYMNFALATSIREMELLPSNTNNGLENCLPPRYNGSIVLIVNLKNGMLLDPRKDSGTTVQSYTYLEGCADQMLKLSKIDGRDVWVISCPLNSKRFYFGSDGPSVDLKTAPSLPGTQDYWYIGRDSSSHRGSWVIKNVQFQTYIGPYDGTSEVGGRITSHIFNQTGNPRWAIIPITFA
ncbi:hypothetical protein EYR41_002368 [Orbilia oligospora]|uniref:Uncharacterized protein n=1 Tax=Orbilia oligospora TaxID=2813651 RepID=A0A7C8PIJ8_ORBOL|nr:hypothetical protein TWF751_012049 [Orbilia oligospora]TGJ62389.1 hypothetical protein EYR41_002368 [Orbilia oligospora]